jgi:ABC-type branched-subunit amino acid transport system ATPase component
MDSGRREPCLVTESVASGDGSGLIVRGVSVQAGPGEVVTIVGPNGSSKSTLLRTIAGLVPIIEGRIGHDGRDITRRPAERRAHGGMAYVPGGRGARGADGTREPHAGGATGSRARS